MRMPHSFINLNDTYGMPIQGKGKKRDFYQRPKSTFSFRVMKSLRITLMIFKSALSVILSPQMADYDKFMLYLTPRFYLSNRLDRRK